MNRQEEADELLQIFMGECRHSPDILAQFHAYKDKYLKPKDELFEKWKEYTNLPDVRRHFARFKKIFKDEINGTKAIEEMRLYCTEHTLAWSPKAYEEIKSRLESNEL